MSEEISTLERIVSALGYAWTAAGSLFNVAVVWYVLDLVHARPETIILPILGIIYVTVRAIGLGFAHSTAVLAFGIDGLELRLVSLNERDFEAEADFRARRDKQLGKMRKKMLIESVGFGVIYLLCLGKFFAEVGAI